MPKLSTTAAAVVWPNWIAAAPTRIVLVADAICPISTAGAELATPTKWCSAIQNRRYPHRSARWARLIVLCNAVAASLPALIGDRSRIDSGTMVTGAPPCTGWARRANRVVDAASRRRGRTSEIAWPAAAVHHLVDDHRKVGGVDGRPE